MKSTNYQAIMSQKCKKSAKENGLRTHLPRAFGEGVRHLWNMRRMRETWERFERPPRETWEKHVSRMRETCEFVRNESKMWERWGKHAREMREMRENERKRKKMRHHRRVSSAIHRHIHRACSAKITQTRTQKKLIYSGINIAPQVQDSAKESPKPRSKTCPMQTDPEPDWEACNKLASINLK